MKIISDFFVYAGNSVIIKLLSLITLPIIARVMSVEDFGIVETVNSSLALLPTIIGLGYDVAILKELALEKEESRKKDIITTVMCFLLVWGGLIILVGISCSKPLAEKLFKDHELYYVLNLAMINTFVNLFYTLFLGVLRALFKTKEYTLLNTTHGIAQNILIVIAVGVFHTGVKGYFVATLVTTVIWTMLAISQNARTYSGNFDKSILRRVIQFGVPVMVSSLAYWIFNLSDRLILTYLTTQEETGYYSMTIRVLSILALVVAAFNKAWTPRAFELCKSNPEHFQDLQEKVHIYCLVGMSILALGNLAGARLMILVFGSSRYLPALSAVAPLAAAYIFQCLTHVSCVGIYIKNKTSDIAVGSWLAATINVLVNFWLIPQYGAVAASISTLIAYFFLYVFYYVRSCKHMGWRMRLTKLFIVISLLGITFFVLKKINIPNIFLDCAIKLACIGVYSVMILLFGIIPRKELKNLFCN